MAVIGTWIGDVDDGDNPVHVDRQGLYFDTAAKQLIAAYNFQVNNVDIQGFTVETWVKFKTIDNNAYVVRKTGMYELYFTDFGGYKACNMMSGQVQYEDASHIVTEEWWFFAGVIQKFNALQSKYCIRLGSFWNCIIYNNVFVENNGQIIVGGGFLGIIRKVKIFQWPKLEWESQHNIRLWSSGGCLPYYTGTACDHCDIENKNSDTDFRYICNSDCMEDEWETDCRACNADCWTCFGSSPYHCHSCFVYDFLLSVTGTFCMENCGDGENHGMHECDDTNTAGGDGCNAYCKVERAHVCVGGTPTSPDAC
mmetsp:Transcript_20697/g.19724  ORF Transcript_20697/g.19724 Transcript_20697/m.19724 type:complete len:310 (+) Transcript_20697:187-1116(+)